MYKNILVTGSDGFIGQYIKNIFNRNGNKIIESKKKTMNLLNKNKIYNTLNRKVELVIHTAALCGAIQSEKNPINFLNTNFYGTVNLLEAMKKKKIKNFIFISSLTVFGSNNKIVNEKSPFAPRHVYAKTKVLCENFIDIFCKKNKINFIILRPTLVVGKGMKEKHALGEFFDTLKFNKTLKIYGSGEHKRDFVHPEDVASLVYKCSSYLFKNTKRYIYDSFNLSNGEYISMIGLAKKIHNFLNKGKIKKIKKTNQTFSLYTSNEKVKRELNFSTKYNNLNIIKELQIS